LSQYTNLVNAKQSKSELLWVEGIEISVELY